MSMKKHRLPWVRLNSISPLPGHTGDSMIIECGDYIFTGDFLFTGDGGVGRDDLPSGRPHHHWQALDVLERFSGEVLVCTGHDPPGLRCKRWHGTVKTTSF